MGNHLTQLQMQHLRRWAQAILAPVDGLNIIHGANASGKTSLLEAIYLLSTGKSFRSAQLAHCIAHDKAHFLITAQLHSDAHSSPLHVGMQKDRLGNSIVRIAGNPANSQAELSRLLPVQVFHPQSHELISGAPVKRRAFMDWGAFHSDPQFQQIWQRFHRILKQRNEALKKKANAQEMAIWNAEFIQWANALSAARQGYIAALLPELMSLVQHMPIIGAFHARYAPGWKEGQSLAEALSADRDKELDRGYTLSGPHRADLRLLAKGGTLFADNASRGQQKALVLALLLAQTRLYQQQSQQRVILLLDDLASELDQSSLAWAFEHLYALNTQTFITALAPEVLSAHPWPNCALFHVEQGQIRFSST